MAEYTPIYTKPYENGWVNAPSEKTPVTAAVMNNYDSAIESIEGYLKDNPIGQQAADDLSGYAKADETASAVDASVSELTLTIQLRTTQGKLLSEKSVTLPSGGGGADIDLVNLVVENSISLGRKAGTSVGRYSVAEGISTTASGDYSYAGGYVTTASGEDSHSEGYATAASGFCSHAEGYESVASGAQSHAEGIGTKAGSSRQHVQGRYNIEDTANKYAHIVGNGVSAAARSNAHTLDWEGNAEYAGTVKSAGLKLTDTVTGQEYILTVADGNLQITSV